MFEDLRYAEWEAQDYPPEVDVDALQAAHPWAGHYFQDDPAWTPDPAWLAELDAMPAPPPDRVYLDEDRPLYDRDRDPDTFTDAEASIAACHALRARLVALLAAQRPAAGDRPVGRPGAAGWETRSARKTAGTGAEDTARAHSGAATGPDSPVGSHTAGSGTACRRPEKASNSASTIPGRSAIQNPDGAASLSTQLRGTGSAGTPPTGCRASSPSRWPRRPASTRRHRTRTS